MGFDFSVRMPTLTAGGGFLQEAGKKDTIKMKILLFSVHLQIRAVSFAGLKGLVV